MRRFNVKSLGGRMTILGRSERADSTSFCLRRWQGIEIVIFMAVLFELALIMIISQEMYDVLVNCHAYYGLHLGREIRMNRKN